MDDVGLLIRSEMRCRWRALLALSLAVALGFGVALTAGAAAHRTDTAYERYLERSAAGDLVINPSIATEEIGAVIEDLPGVVQASSDSLLVATAVAGSGPEAEERLAAAGDEGPTVRGSIDGRYTEMDRPAVAEGRLATGGHEAFLTEEAAEDLGVGVGDTVTVAFWPAIWSFTGPPEDPAEAVPNGMEELTVVGTGTLADEALPETLYPRATVIVSADVAEPYTCLIEVPGEGLSEQEQIETLFPPGCSLNFQYWSLALADGAAGQDEAEEAFLARAAELEEDLPPVFENTGSYFLISTNTADQADQVDDALQPTVAAVALFGLAAGLSTLLAVATVVARMVRRSDADQGTWRTLGLTAGQRTLIAAAPPLAALAVGSLLALMVAFVASPVGPLGTARVVEPAPALDLDLWAALAVAGFAAVLAALTLMLSRVRARRAYLQPRPPRARSWAARATRLSRPPLAAGLRMALGGGGALVAVGAASATAALVGALTFGTNLDALIDQPARYGWPWDLAVTTNFGYPLGTDRAAVDADLAGRPDVVSWGHAALPPDVVVDGLALTALVDVEGFDRITVVDGRLPAARDEVALGNQTADELGVTVGDEVEVGGADALVTEGDVGSDGLVGDQTRTATVVGTVVLPPVGPYQARHMSSGTGVVLASTWLVPAIRDSEMSPASFVAVDLTDGADPQDLIDDLGGDLGHWGNDAIYTTAYTEPVRPPQIVNAASMRTSPLLLAVVLVLAMVIALGVTLALTVRARRHDLAILRVVGFTGADLRAAVRWQTVSLLAAGLVVGVPAGVAIGRASWTAFADQLSVDPTVTTPAGWLVLTVLGTLAVGLLAAVLPGRSAARARPADALREE